MNSKSKNQVEEQAIPQGTLQSIRDLVYQSRGSVIPQYQKRFERNSLMVARFTDTHEGAPDVLDLIAFKNQEEKRYLLDMHQRSKELTDELEKQIADENLYLVIGICGTYHSSELAFITLVDRLESPLLLKPVYDRFLLTESLFLHAEGQSLKFQRCIRR